MALPVSLTDDAGTRVGAKMSAQRAGYMELRGASKNGDCRIVEVPGGVSKELGCCNEFKPQDDSVQQFRCGTCLYLVESPGGERRGGGSVGAAGQSIQ